MKISHFRRQKYWKKLRRQKKRIFSAQSKNVNIDNETELIVTNEINPEEIKWLEREREAQKEWQIKQKLLLKPVESSISHYSTKGAAPEIIKTVPKLPFDLPYRNPFEPEFFDQSNRDICHFYRKTGVCRFDIRCSRLHETPIVSDTIVFINMFNASSMEIVMAGGDPDINLECDENDLNNEYEDFYLDIKKELVSFGRVITIRTCRNGMRHLRGNVYVQYRNINDAVYAFSQLNGRFYGGIQLSARFVTIENWRESICGLYFRGRCPKRGICNFLHVLLNPGETCRDLHQFLNRSTDSHHRSSVRHSTRYRNRSRTCSSIDETSTPEPGGLDELTINGKKSLSCCSFDITSEGASQRSEIIVGNKKNLKRSSRYRCHSSPRQSHHKSRHSKKRRKVSPIKEKVKKRKSNK